MHKVVRNVGPLKLMNKDKEWKIELSINPDLKPNWSGFSKSVAKKETLNALDEMYVGCCCYCESKVKSTSYPEIDHFKPKQKYRDLCYDYNNLHYSCKRCNLSKSDFYDFNIIDPSEDNPEEYIKYIGDLAISIEDNIRGNTMIDLIKLNKREDLLEERSKYLNEFSKNYDLLIKSIELVWDRDDNENIELVKPFIKSFVENVESKSKHGESYCTMVKHNFSDKLQMLIEVLKFPVI